MVDSKAIHQTKSEYAGKTVTLKTGETYRVEDWWDRLGTGSWKSNNRNPACANYSVRRAEDRLPHDDEVLYGKIGPFGHLIHITEVEGLKE